VALAICLATPAAAQFGSPRETTLIAKNIYSFGNSGGRSLWVEMPGSVVVFDAINVTSAKELRASIAVVTDKPVSHVIYSHEHYDHIRGGHIFADEGAEFIAHEKCLDTFDYVPDPDVVPPTITYSDTYTLDLGGPRIELLYLGRNHGDCMTITHFPGEKLLFVVDLLSEEALPFGNLPDYYPGDTVRTLREILQIDFERAARGHRSPVVGREVVESTLGYWSDLMDAVKQELDAGTSPFEVITTVELPQYRSWQNYDRWFELHVERVMWHYVIGW
jgi:glyoxylase-like metal-dependent hydrolase (beta-lactamase superfamily II)